MPECSSSAESNTWMKLEAKKCTPYLLDAVAAGAMCRQLSDEERGLGVGRTRAGRREREGANQADEEAADLEFLGGWHSRSETRKYATDQGGRRSWSGRRHHQASSARRSRSRRRASGVGGNGTYHVEKLCAGPRTRATSSRMFSSAGRQCFVAIVAPDAEASEAARRGAGGGGGTRRSACGWRRSGGSGGA